MSDLSPEEQAARSALYASARERGLRSLAWGLGLDVLTAITVVLLTTVTAIEWTPQYWAALGGAVAKSAIQAGVAYLARLLIRPKES